MIRSFFSFISLIKRTKDPTTPAGWSLYKLTQALLPSITLPGVPVKRWDLPRKELKSVFHYKELICSISHNYFRVYLLIIRQE